ncbi:hypothetical protein [Pseudomonas putida]|uniref:Uncharacterized protein n=1 Tax=Pseudomonas putida TaxID=303 RepID=A0A1Q9R5R1_PSEPU|nr:hypothetical protein [Pseudomonas putida]OLS62750.1 hypothetical protein PSEMO_23110 [Pseudomonas putida]
MSPRILLGSLVLSTSLGAQALETENRPQAELIALATTLAQHAGSSQWQLLWQRSREAGHLTPGKAAHFTLPAQRIDELTRATLASPHSATAEKRTRVQYRRDFQPLVLGNLDGSPLSALCLTVDWRTLPERTGGDAGPWMGQVSLLLSQPCP